jgi:O-glycosyl hydrolase
MISSVTTYCRFIFLLLAGASMFVANATTHEVIVDLSEEHQVIDHFGASDCWSMQKIGGWSEPNRERIAQLLFSQTEGIGLSAWRFNIGAGVDHENIPPPWRTAETFEVAEGKYDWSRQSNEQRMLFAAKRLGVETFIAFANSPPARMTRNGRTQNTEGADTTNLKDGFAGQYARYLADILTHFRNDPDPAKRIEFDWISPINEPQWEWNEAWQEGNRASNKDIIAVAVALQSELERQQLDANILLAECGEINHMWEPLDWMGEKYGEPYGDYLDAICGNSAVNSFLGNVISCHAYYSDLVPDRLVPRRERLRAALDEYPGWRYWQTEYCVMQGANDQGGRARDLGMDTALEVARVIYVDLAVADASAWSWWTAVSPEDYKDGLLYTDYKEDGDDENILTSKTLWALGHYSRFIRPGFKRIGLSGADELEGVLGSAYRSPSNDQVVVVLLNQTEEQASVQMKLDAAAGSFRAEQVELYLTSDETDLEKQETVRLDDSIIMPKRSIGTVIIDLKAD